MVSRSRSSGTGCSAAWPAVFHVNGSRWRVRHGHERGRWPCSRLLLSRQLRPETVTLERQTDCAAGALLGLVRESHHLDAGHRGDDAVAAGAVRSCVELWSGRRGPHQSAHSPRASRKKRTHCSAPSGMRTMTTGRLGRRVDGLVVPAVQRCPGGSAGFGCCGLGRGRNLDPCGSPVVAPVGCSDIWAR
jgi:hypothetical protein